MGITAEKWTSKIFNLQKVLEAKMFFNILFRIFLFMCLESH